MSDTVVQTIVDALVAALEPRLQKLAPSIDPLVDCKTFGAPKKTWNAAARAGELRARKVGREYLALLSDAKAWFESLPSAKTDKPEPTTTTTADDVEPVDAMLMHRRLLRPLQGGRR